MSQSVIPAVLTDDLAEVKLKLDKIKGSFDRVQIDFIDGVFADNLTVLPAQLTSKLSSKLNGMADLMVVKPFEYLDKLAQLGFRQVVAPIQSLSGGAQDLKRIKDLGFEAGVSVDINSKLPSPSSLLWPELDILELMPIAAGFSGQSFSPQVLARVDWVRDFRLQKRLKFEIVIDGGINDQTGLSCLNAGADSLVINSWLWRQSDISAVIAQFDRLEKSVST